MRDDFFNALAGRRYCSTVTRPRLFISVFLDCSFLYFSNRVTISLQTSALRSTATWCNYWSRLSSPQTLLCTLSKFSFFIGHGAKVFFDWKRKKKNRNSLLNFISTTSSVKIEHLSFRFCVKHTVCAVKTVLDSILWLFHICLFLTAPLHCKEKN